MFNTFKIKEKLLYTKNAKRKKQGKYWIKNKNKEKERMINNTTPEMFIIATKTKISTVKDIHQETTIITIRVILNYQVFLDHSFK